DRAAGASERAAAWPDHGSRRGRRGGGGRGGPRRSPGAGTRRRPAGEEARRRTGPDGESRRMRRLVPLLLIGLAACGYGLPGTRNVPQGARTVRIEPFHNHTRENGLEVRLHRALEDEFRRRGTLRVVGKGEGDIVLSGDIRRFTSIPVAFSATDEAVQYQGVIQVGMRLVERQSGRVLHE